MSQFPHAFEFRSNLLVRLADHSESGWFGTFLFNNPRQRMSRETPRLTTSLWAHVAVRARNPRRPSRPQAERAAFTNEKYSPATSIEPLRPRTSLKWLALWNEYFLRYDQSQAVIEGALALRIAPSLTHVQPTRQRRTTTACRAQRPRNSRTW